MSDFLFVSESGQVGAGKGSFEAIRDAIGDSAYAITFGWMDWRPMPHSDDYARYSVVIDEDTGEVLGKVFELRYPVGITVH